jgi:prepilin-type N-terminal cleavage/methylation domain-containing protein
MYMKKNRGFTVIELMVAMSLFVIVVGVVSGTFIRSLRTQRQLTSLMAANDNASQTLEQMTREIRTGTDFTASGSRLSFTNDAGEVIAYDLAGGRIERNGRPLTASNVLVTYLAFSTRGATPGDGLSTRVTVMMGVSARGKMESFVTRLQTTVAARVLDG